MEEGERQREIQTDRDRQKERKEWEGKNEFLTSDRKKVGQRSKERESE